MQKELGFIGDRKIDLIILKSWDEKRLSPLGCGLTTRTIDPAVKAELDIHLDKYPDIYDEFYATSELSLFEREAKDSINTQIVLSYAACNNYAAC
jgi:hypothetical protein